MGNEPGLGEPSFYYIQTQTAWGRTLASFAAWCEPQPGWRVLDIGSGPGLLPALFTQHGCRAFGIDLDPQSLLVDRLHPQLAVADAQAVPFEGAGFHLVTASNVLFLMDNPQSALLEMRRLLRPEGQIAVLNPSELLTVQAAVELAEERQLYGGARSSLINWAQRAEEHSRWGIDDLRSLFASAGLNLVQTVLRVGPGFARFSRGTLSGFGDEKV